MTFLVKLRNLLCWRKAPRLDNAQAYEVVQRAIAAASNSEAHKDLEAKLLLAQESAFTGTEAWVNIACVFRDEHQRLGELVGRPNADGVCDYVTRVLKNQA